MQSVAGFRKHSACARSCGGLEHQVSWFGERERVSLFLVNLAAGLPCIMGAQPWRARRSCSAAPGIRCTGGWLYARVLFVNKIWGNAGKKAPVNFPQRKPRLRWIGAAGKREGEAKPGLKIRMKQMKTVYI
jgi:hypothetical protein